MKVVCHLILVDDTAIGSLVSALKTHSAAAAHNFRIAFFRIAIRPKTP
jgi:hypothetical protein